MVCYLLCFLFVLLIVVSFGGVGYEIVQCIKRKSSNGGVRWFSVCPWCVREGCLYALSVTLPLAAFFFWHYCLFKKVC